LPTAAERVENFPSAVLLRKPAAPCHSDFCVIYDG
jgi:hypothetical protein